MRNRTSNAACLFVSNLQIPDTRANAQGIDPRRKRFLPVLLAVLILAPHLAADERATNNELSRKLKPMSRSELEKAVAAGTVICSRAIHGQDIAAVLLAQTGAAEKCRPRSALRMENSYIDGEILVEQKRTKKVESEDEDTVEAPKQGTTMWISIPIAIQTSEINAKVTFSRIGIGCILDLRNSKFDEMFSLNDVVVTGDTALAGAVFMREFEVFSSSWKGSVNARRAQFMGNAEFIPAGGQQLSQFLSVADFEEAVFHRFANFIGTKFQRSMNFRYVQFKSDANFSNTSLSPSAKPTGPFYMTEFSGRSTFRGAHFRSLRFWRTTFRDEVEFENIHGLRLELWMVSLGGRADFSDARIDRLEFHGWIAADGEVLFRRSQFNNLTVSRAGFRKDVDFEGTKFCSQVEFRIVSFEGDLHFEDAVFPWMNHPCDHKSNEHAESAFLLVDTTLNKGLYVEPDQLLTFPSWWAFWRSRSPSFASSNPPNENDELTPDEKAAVAEAARAKERRLWRELERAFRAAGNLELENYAAYNLRSLEEPEQRGLTKISSILSRWFWGYGLRPLRVALWLALLVLVFAFVYWTQLATIAADESVLVRRWLRAKYALVFSARTTWQLSYGYEQSRTTTFRVVTLLQSAAGKALLTCFAYSLSHTSPLLNELMKKLLP